MISMTRYDAILEGYVVVEGDNYYHGSGEVIPPPYGKWGDLDELVSPCLDCFDAYDIDAEFDDEDVVPPFDYTHFATTINTSVSSGNTNASSTDASPMDALINALQNMQNNGT